MRKKEDNIEKGLVKALLEELNEDPSYKFKLVFSVMSVIPFLVFFYTFFNITPHTQLFSKQSSIVLLLAIFISLCGFVWGYGVTKRLFKKLILYAAKVKHSEQLKSELVASVSHDFKTPISVLKLSLSGIADSSLGPVNLKQKERLDACQDSLDHMRHSIDTLLDLYKIEAGLVDLKKDPHNIADILEKELKEFQIMFDKKRIKLSKVISKDLTSMIDKDKIVEVISNILGNALKYTPDEGTVDIKAHSHDGFVRIEFTNSGGQIEPDKLTVIFEKFRRLDSAQEGTGLGLAIAKDIVEMHDGHIWAENLPNKRIKFVFIIPEATK